jgi:hypothetical protein
MTRTETGEDDGINKHMNIKNGLFYWKKIIQYNTVYVFEVME